jgi:VWFA-related protein
LLLATSGARGQTDETTTPTDQSFSEIVSVEQVLVPVVVRKGSRFVDNLKVSDFALFVDDVPTPISSFERSSGAPVHTLVLQDLSGSMGGWPKLELSRRLLSLLLAEGRPGDLYSLGTFAASGVHLQPESTSDRDVILGWSSTWEAFGSTGIHDAVAQIPELISADSAWRSAVLLITDGIDNASVISPREARAAARQAEVPVHVVALVGRPTHDEVDDPDWSSDPLKLLSWVTGGQFHSIEDPANVNTASEEFMSELRSQYILGFPTSGTGRVQPREIRVEVRGKRRQVSFRREYLGTAPGPPGDSGATNR